MRLRRKAPMPLCLHHASLQLSIRAPDGEAPAIPRMPLLAVGADWGHASAAVGRSRTGVDGGTRFPVVACCGRVARVGTGRVRDLPGGETAGGDLRPVTRDANGVAEVMPTQPTALPGQPTPTLLPSPTVNHVRDLPAGRFNVLVLGTDMRPNDTDHTPRSDTIMLANVDTISHTVRIMSIPRDLIVTIPGYGRNKINAAYVFGEYYHEPGGGPALALQTVSNLFNVPVDYYVTLNFDGFRAIVDAVGGMAIDVPYSIDDDSYPDDEDGNPNGTITVHFDAGWQCMDGKTALRYARTRHADNDFARSKRQLQVIMAIRQKALSLDLLPSIPSIIDKLGGLVQTNIPFDQQLGLAQLGFNMRLGHNHVVDRRYDDYGWTTCRTGARGSS